MRSPKWRSGLMGTVGFTSVGMFGKGGTTWGLGMPNHTLAVTAGSIAEKPGVIDGEIVGETPAEALEYLGTGAARTGRVHRFSSATIKRRSPRRTPTSSHEPSAASSYTR